MKKLATLFQDSYNELKHVRTVTTIAMFASIGIILGSLTVQIGDFIKIGFSSIANQFVYYLFGPATGCFYGGALDILKYLITPPGAFFPGWTVGAMPPGVLYGCFFYKRKLTIVRVLAAELCVSVVCNMILGTLWLDMMYGKGFFVLLPMRVIKNLVMWPVNSFLFYTMTMAMEQTGIFRLIRKSA